MITFTNVSKAFKTSKGLIHAVDDVSLEINDGEIFGIIGYSGAGKSTLLRVINQLEIQDSGSVEIDGVSIEKLSKKQLLKQRCQIGMIFQHFNLLWSRTVFENIALPLELAGVNKKDQITKVNELIDLVGLQGKQDSYPSNLSGGQKQRVAIARALANDPKILLCDEATSALDPQTTEAILDLLKEINSRLKITIVLITHQMEVVSKLCHKVAVMVDGKVVEVNSVDDIFTNPTHDATKRFVKTMNHVVEEKDLIKTLKTVYKDGGLLRLTFNEEIAKEPIMASIFKTTDMEISIVHANLTNTLTSSFGVMYVFVANNNNNDINTLIDKLIDKKVIVEVI